MIRVYCGFLEMFREACIFIDSVWKLQIIQYLKNNNKKAQ